MEKPDALSRHADHGSRAGDNDNITLLQPELFAIQALEGISAQGDEVNILRDIHQGNREEMQEDSVAKAALALQSCHCQVLLTTGAQSTRQILTRWTRCQSTCMAGLKDERWGRVQISGCVSERRGLSECSGKGWLIWGTRSRQAGVPVSSADKRINAGG